MSGHSELSDDDYDDLLKPLARELSGMARWVAETGQRMVILFEGRDTAGKGGSIEMFARVLNPRQCNVVALPTPNERERTQWYFQRYVEHLPARGEIALFDRSWYNRAGVERVMGFCTPEQTQAFLNRLGDPFAAKLSDADGRAGIEFGVTGVPETYLVGKDGMILDKHTGPLEDADVRTLTRRVLAAR